MPYKIENGELVEITGKITDWLRDFNSWYSEDASGFNDSVDVGGYVHLLLVPYAMAAHEEWEKSLWGGKAKCEKLDSHVEMTAEGPKVDVLPALDFLAENLDDEFRKKHSVQAREFAKEIMAKSVGNY